MHDSNGNTAYTPGLAHRESVADRFYNADWIGSTRYLSDSTGNSFPSALRYDAFGQRSATAGPAHPSDFQFAGAWGYQTEFDPTSESGLRLQYLQQRYFDPAVGRFISPDPIGFAGGLNLYAYTLNGPVDATDPRGHGIFDEDDGSPAFDQYYTSPLFARDPEMVNAGFEAADYYAGYFPGYDLAMAIRGRDIMDRYMSMWERILRGVGGAADFLPGLAGLIGEGAARYCFPAGTPVLMADGSRKPIEAIRPGDTVLSADERTAEQSRQQVVQTFARQADELLKIVTEDGRSIEATPEHPFWVQEKGFVEAKRLARSDLLADADGGSVAVSSVGPGRGQFTVYNFEVASTHTYFAGTPRLWVHNRCGWEYHHTYPIPMRSWFEGPGRIPDIDDFTVYIPADFNDILHSGGARGGWWNEQWRAFMQTYPTYPVRNPGQTGCREPMGADPCAALRLAP